MRRKILLSACAIFAIYGTLTAANEDSTKIFESGNKRIVVKENEQKQRLEVEVYEFNNNQDSTFYEQIFEGHYRDGKSNEQRKYITSVNIRNPRWNIKSFDPHWAGFGFGFADFTEDIYFDDYSFSNCELFDNRKSFEFSFNFFEIPIPLSKRHRLGLVTGLGIRWTSYFVKGNFHFEEIDDYTDLVKAPEGVRYKSSRLGLTTLNIPLLFEWQDKRGNAFVSGGILGSAKTWSYSRIEYYDDNEIDRRLKKRHKEKVDQGMTLRAINMDLFVQGGFRFIGAYARYSPLSIFKDNKGPELYPFSFGLMLHF